MKLKLLTFSLLSLFISLAYNQEKAFISKDLSKYNLKHPNTPESWEDGMRTSGEKGTFEWWYFDSHLEDSSTIVIIFFTKPFIDINKGLNPFCIAEITKKNGEKIRREYIPNKKAFSASTNKCEVVMGKCFMKGDLNTYHIHFEDDSLNIDLQLHKTIESWRPNTGHLNYGDTDYFAWLVAVPSGEVTANYKIGENSVSTKGTGYRDHNWGNEPLPNLINHWYWSRAKIGPYNIITSEMISEKEFDNQSIIVFNLSKGGKVIEDKGEYVTLLRSYGKIHPTLKKPISEDLTFIYQNPNDEYRYEYSLHKERTLMEIDLLSSAIKNKTKKAIAKTLTGFDGAYFRLTGTAEIKIYKNDQLLESYKSNDTVWELMFFGKVRQ